MASYQEAYNNVEFEKLDKMAEKIYNKKNKQEKCEYLKEQKASPYSHSSSENSDSSSIQSSVKTNSSVSSLENSLNNSLDNISISSLNSNINKVETFNNLNEHLDFNNIHNHINICLSCRKNLLKLLEDDLKYHENFENKNSIFGDISTRDILLILLIIVVFVYVVKNVLNKN